MQEESSLSDEFYSMPSSECDSCHSHESDDDIEIQIPEESNISKRLNDIICEEKYEGEITISRSRIKDKNVKFMQQSILEPSSGKNVEKVNFKKEMLRSDMIIRKRIKDKRSISNLSGGFKNNLSKVRLSPHKEMQNISPFGHQ